MKSSPENFRGRSGPRAPSKGSLLIAAMLLAGIIGISLVSYLNLARTALKTANRSFYANASVDVAEIGVEQAMACFYQVTAGTAAATAFADWTRSGNDATRIFPSASTTYSVGPNATAVVRVYVHYYAMNGTPVIVAKSTITPPDGATINKYIEVTLRSRSLFANGLVSKNAITWVGHPSADSWDSTASGAYAAAAQKAGVTLGALNGSITLGSGGNVYGYATTGSTGTTSGGSVHGLATTTNDSTRISNDFSANFPAVATPASSSLDHSYTIASGSVPVDFPRASDVANTSDSKYYYYFDSGANISATTTIGTTVPNKNVVFIMNNHFSAIAIGFTGSKSLTIKTGSALTLYTNGNIDAHGNGVLNGTTAGANKAAALIIYGTGTTAGSQSITVGGNGQLYAAIYAPNATLTLQGGGSSGKVLGSVVADSISMNGGTDFHYDEALASLNSGAGVGVSKWKELQSAAERNTYATQLNF